MKRSEFEPLLVQRIRDKSFYPGFSKMIAKLMCNVFFRNGDYGGQHFHMIITKVIEALKETNEEMIAFEKEKIASETRTLKLARAWKKKQKAKRITDKF